MYALRIVCLTEETCETLYLLGAQELIVGISGFTVRPASARREKPRVSSFLSARFDRIMALEPDLVLGFSDLQADLAAQLVRRGIEVHVFNQRSVAGILAAVCTLGGMIGMQHKAETLAQELQHGLDRVRAIAAQLPRRPRVYFEEWDSPQISAIGWVSELIGIAGGVDCFAELGRQPLGRDRIIADADEVIRRAPDLIFGSWCGKKFRPDSVAARHGWQAVPAVRDGELYEIKSSLILQPGPAALTEGVALMQQHLCGWASRHA